MSQIVINEYIVANPNICHGKPVFKGTRIMVWQVLEMLAAGENTQKIKKAFPVLTLRHISAALAYAGSLTEQSYVIINTQSTHKKPVFA